MVQLADSSGKVPLLAERLRQAQLSRDRLSEDLTVGNDPRTVRVQSGQHRVAAGTAEGERAVGPLELHTASGQLVDVGGLDLFVPITTQDVVEIIRDDKQHIGARVRRHR